MGCKFFCSLVLCLFLSTFIAATGVFGSARVVVPKAATPKPAIAPVSWELKFQFEDPQRVSVVLPGQDRPEVYWYMLYTVANPAEQEMDFYPFFELVTDTLQVIRSETNISPEAFKAIRRRAGDPLLVAPHAASGRLQRGKDRARHSMAIWRDFDPKAKAFTVYVSGLSGEVIRWKNPAYDRGKPEGPANRRFFVLRKTLAVPYKFPGARSERLRAVPERVTREQKWMMR